MNRHVIALLIAFASIRCTVVAQTSVDPSGHWAGTFHAAEVTGLFEIDLQKTGNGDFIGTVTIPAENVKGLPLANVQVEGRAVTFYAREDQPTTVRIADDGRTMTGEMSAEGYRIPVTMTRTGDAKIDAPPLSAAIAAEFEGRWSGTFTASGKQVRLVLSLTNESGTSAGSFVNLDQGNLRIPASAIAQTGSSIVIELNAIGGSYSAVLDQGKAELTGTFTQGTRGAPLILRREVK